MILSDLADSCKMCLRIIEGRCISLSHCFPSFIVQQQWFSVYKFIRKGIDNSWLHKMFVLLLFKKLLLSSYSLPKRRFVIQNTTWKNILTIRMLILFLVFHFSIIVFTFSLFTWVYGYLVYQSAPKFLGKMNKKLC